MVGGNYSTWFVDEGKGELRKVLYYLENLGITRVKSKKIKGSINSKLEEDQIKKVRNLAKSVEDKHLKKLLNKWKPSWTEYRWVLTNKGKSLVESNDTLKKLQKEGDALKFFTALKDEIEKKEYFIR